MFGSYFIQTLLYEKSIFSTGFIMFSQIYSSATLDTRTRVCTQIYIGKLTQTSTVPRPSSDSVITTKRKRHVVKGNEGYTCGIADPISLIVRVTTCLALLPNKGKVKIYHINTETPYFLPYLSYQHSITFNLLNKMFTVT